jgi:denticleless
VTSLVALQSMPGMLASGGSYDGYVSSRGDEIRANISIVKLWDLRFPASEKKTPKPSAMAWGELPDPTTNCANPSRRARSINALVESPTTGDLFAMCGDSKIHALRPACARSSDEGIDTQAILPRTYTDPNLRVSTFYLRASISPDGKYLACGSTYGGIMAWDINGKTDAKGEVKATRLGFGKREDTEVSAIDWGHDMVSPPLIPVLQSSLAVGGLCG